MSPIRILHASDLHIAGHIDPDKPTRSPIDKIYDQGWNSSILRQLSILGRPSTYLDFLRAWWDRMAASAYEPKVLTALAQYIAHEADVLDAVILTGDLATTGSPDDIDRTELFLTAPGDTQSRYLGDGTNGYFGPTISNILKSRGTTVPVIILPGNHDRFVPTKGFNSLGDPLIFDAGGTEFDRLQSSQEGVQVYDLPAIDVNGLTLKVAIITADMTLRKYADANSAYLGWIAQGRVYADTQKEIVEQTDRLAAEKQADEVLSIIWAGHFPPLFPGISKSSRLVGQDKFVDTANQLGIKAILAGHTHIQCQYRPKAGDCTVYCCGTTTQWEPASIPGGETPTPNAFQILEIDLDAAGKPTIVVKEYRYVKPSTYESGHPGPGARAYAGSPWELFKHQPCTKNRNT